MASDALSQFIAITGASDVEANRMLIATDYNIEHAVELFFSTHTSDNSQSRNHSNDSADITHSRSRNKHNVSTDLKDDYGDIRPPDAVMRQTLIQNSIVPRNSSFTSHRTLNAPFSGIVGNTADSHDKKLAKLFKPPYKLIFKGTLKEAREYCAVDKKWILVNIQDDTDFSCMTLNRLLSNNITSLHA